MTSKTRNPLSFTPILCIFCCLYEQKVALFWFLSIYLLVKFYCVSFFEKGIAPFLVFFYFGMKTCFHSPGVIWSDQFEAQRVISEYNSRFAYYMRKDNSLNPGLNFMNRLAVILRVLRDFFRRSHFHFTRIAIISRIPVNVHLKVVQGINNT